MCVISANIRDLASWLKWRDEGSSFAITAIYVTSKESLGKLAAICISQLGQQPLSSHPFPVISAYTFPTCERELISGSHQAGDHGSP